MIIPVISGSANAAAAAPSKEAPEAVSPESIPRLPQPAPKAEQNPDVVVPHIDPQKQPEPTPEPTPDADGKWRL